MGRLVAPTAAKSCRTLSSLCYHFLTQTCCHHAKGLRVEDAEEERTLAARPTRQVSFSRRGIFLFVDCLVILAQLGTCAQCANTARRTKTANDSRERFCEKNSVAHLHANASCQVASSGKVGMRSKRCASNLLPNQRIFAPPLTFTRRAWQLLWQVDSRDAPHRPLMHDMHMYMVRMRAASCRWRFELMAAACLSPYIFNQPSSSPSRSASCATCVLTHCSII